MSSRATPARSSARPITSASAGRYSRWNCAAGRAAGDVELAPLRAGVAEQPVPGPVGADQAGGRALAEHRGLRDELGVPGERLLPGEHQRQRTVARPGAARVVRRPAAGRPSSIASSALAQDCWVRVKATRVAEPERAADLVQRVDRIRRDHGERPPVQHEPDPVLLPAQRGEPGRGVQQQVGQRTGRDRGAPGPDRGTGGTAGPACRSVRAAGQALDRHPALAEGRPRPRRAPSCRPGRQHTVDGVTVPTSSTATR